MSVTNDPTFETGMLELYEGLDERVRSIEALVTPHPAGWAVSLAWLIDRYITRRNMLSVAGTAAAIYATYFAATVVNAPLT